METSRSGPPQISGMQELGRGEAWSCEPRTTELPANSHTPGELGWWLGGLWNTFLPPGLSQADVSQPGHRGLEGYSEELNVGNRVPPEVTKASSHSYLRRLILCFSCSLQPPLCPGWSTSFEACTAHKSSLLKIPVTHDSEMSLRNISQ